MNALTFAPRGRRLDTPAGKRLVYLSRCGSYRVEKSELAGLPVVWRACHLTEAGCWEIISPRHRAKHTAAQACQRHARRNPRSQRRRERP